MQDKLEEKAIIKVKIHQQQIKLLKKRWLKELVLDKINNKRVVDLFLQIGMIGMTQSILRSKDKPLLNFKRSNRNLRKLTVPKRRKRSLRKRRREQLVVMYLTQMLMITHTFNLLVSKQLKSLRWTKIQILIDMKKKKLELV